MADQYTLQNPVEMYADISRAEHSLQGPGLDRDLQSKADLGEETYRGSGRLAGRKALITGGDSGIGGATAIAYAREGADVAISYLPEEAPDAERIAELIRDAGQKALLFPGDLKDQEYCEQTVRDAHEGLGGLDILVCNAAMQKYCYDLNDLSTEQFDDTYRTNVYSLFWMTREAKKLMKPGSAIIASSSIQAYKPSSHLLDYASTKSAMNNYSKGLAEQLAPLGIRVNVVAPGPVWTPLQAAGGQPPEALPGFGEGVGLGRPGQPAELAPAYVFLASQESSYVVGETLHVNGGMPTP